MKIKSDFILREIADDYIVVPLGESANTIKGVLSLNVTGAFLWKSLEEEQTLDTLVNQLMNEYDVEELIANKSVLDFVEKIRNIGCIEE